MRIRRSRFPDGSVAVMFIDLDGFKAVNDGMGHDAGDKLLVECARRLRLAVRPWDTVARFGGDEFTVLCEDVQDDAGAASVADEIRRALSAPVHLPAGEVFVTASIGIARASAALGRLVDGYRDGARADKEFAASWNTAVLQEFVADAVGDVETSGVLNYLAAVIDVLARYAAGIQVFVESIVKSSTPEDEAATAFIDLLRECFRRILRDDPE